VNEIPVRQTEIQSQLSQISTLAEKDTLIKSVGDLYWDLVGLEENRKVLEETVTISKQMVIDAKVKLDEGNIKESVLKQSKLRLLNHQQDLKNIIYEI
jgi:outer membrane protein TolC